MKIPWLGVAAFVGGWAVSKAFVFSAAVATLKNASRPNVIQQNAEGAAAIAGAVSPVVGYVGRESEPLSLFAAGMGAGAAVSLLKVSRWGGAA